MKLETIASPDSRSDCGRKLQKGFGWTLGAEGASVFVAGVAILSPSGHRQAEGARDLACEVDAELSIIEGGGEREPGEGLRCRPGDVAPVTGVHRAVAWTEEAMGDAEGCALDLHRLRLGQRPPPHRAAGAGADGGAGAE